MRHYSEQEIEQLLLQKGIDPAGQGQLERHTAECHSCREMYEELVAFYSALTADKKLLAANHETAGLTLSPGYGEIEGLRPLPVRAWIWARRSPAFISFSAGLLFLIGLFVLLRPSGEMTNVGFTKLNDAKAQLEVYANDGRILWAVPYRRGADYERMERSGYNKYSAVADLKGSGTNDVVMLIPPAAELDEFGIVRAFAADAQPLWTWKYEEGESIRYRETVYPKNLQPRSILPFRNLETGRDELFACFVNSHSPSVLIRLDGEGGSLGALWNQGHFTSVVPYDVGQDGSRELIVTGYDDESKGGFISVVDPFLIQGKTASVRSPGFEFPRSGAERLIIHVPEPPWIISQARRFAFHAVTLRSPQEVTIAWGGGGVDELLLTFSFDVHMNLRSIIPTDSWADFREQNPKLNIPSASAVREWFFREIRVWDGSVWKKGWN